MKCPLQPGRWTHPLPWIAKTADTCREEGRLGPEKPSARPPALWASSASREPALSSVLSICGGHQRVILARTSLRFAGWTVLRGAQRRRSGPHPLGVRRELESGCPLWLPREFYALRDG